MNNSKSRALTFYRWNALTVFLIMAALILSSCKKPEPVSAPDNVDYYTCTMHPSVRSHKPDDKCPICGMNLVPVLKKTASTATNGVSDQPGEFVVATQRQQQIGVTYATIQKQPFSHVIRTVGVVTFELTRHWDYVARVEGYVEKQFVGSRGELVEKDAPLLTLYSPDMLTTENEFLSLLKSTEDAQTNHDRALMESNARLLDSARQRLRLWNIGDAQIAELEKSRQPSEFLMLRSPFKGVIQNLDVNQGHRVMTGEHLLSIADLSEVWVWSEFYQDELPMLKIGLPITITSSAYPGEKFTGRISVIDPFVNDSLRTGRVRIDVENPELKLRPNMYVDADLAMDMGEHLGVPSAAVLPTGKHNVVFVDKGAGRLEPRFVELGRKYGEYYEVNSGLTENERVVTSANFLIDAEAKIQGALKSW